jgi:hypothetical protein
MAYPRTESDAAFVNRNPREIAQFRKEPLSVAALGIKEDLP